MTSTTTTASGQTNAETVTVTVDAASDFKIQILSDIHLEFWPQLSSVEDLPVPLCDIPVNAPILALLGDIGVPSLPLYRLFLQRMSEKFKLVFVISGNHEYYQGVLDEVEDAIRSITTEYPNIHYLQRSSYEINGIVFLGSTFWTLIPETPEEVFNDYWQRLNDYRQIRIKDEGKVRGIEPKDTNRLHREDKQWLRDTLVKGSNEGKKFCIFTHHAPVESHSQCAEMRPGSPNNALKFIDFSDQTDLIWEFNRSILLWGFGHTHYSSSQLIGNTQVVCNCLGYILKDTPPPEFDPSFVVYPLKPEPTTRGHYSSQCRIL